MLREDLNFLTSKDTSSSRRNKQEENGGLKRMNSKAIISTIDFAKSEALMLKNKRK